MARAQEVSTLYFGYLDNMLVIIFIVLYIALSGAYFVPLALSAIYEKIPTYYEDLNEILKSNMDEKNYPFIEKVKVGKYIGIFERILIVIMLLMNQIGAIGFIIAAKSLARFKMMENKIFAEYYLLGTMLSIVYTFAMYYLFRVLLL